MVSRYTTNEVSNADTIKVTTYNVLSSHLSEASYFTSCDPAALHPPARMRELQKMLEVEVAQGRCVYIASGSVCAYMFV